jgi:hypothetical protein
MKGASKAVLLVAAALLVAGLLAYAWMNGMFSGGDKGKGGATTLSFTVQFKDGTTRTFETSNIYTGKLCVVPFTLFVGGKEIAGINVDLKIRLTTGGRKVNSYSAQIAQRMEIYKSGQTTPITSSTGKYNPTGDGWADGDTKTVLSTPITSAMIEQAISQYSGNGDYYFQVAVQISLTVNADDGVYTLAGSGVGGIDITFQQYQAMSMTATVSVSPMTLVTP